MSKYQIPKRAPSHCSVRVGQCFYDVRAWSDVHQLELRMTPIATAMFEIMMSIYRDIERAPFYE